ncbi:MAG: hypothetical protein WC833_04785 [Bacteroidales bacterium]|jgi:hypothetical protein
MKLKNINTGVNKILFILAMVLMILPLSACAQKVKFLTSTVVPAAQGTVKVKKDINKNYRIKIHIDNLAEPNRLDPPKSAYVIWLVTDEKVTQNIGKIKTATNFLSKKLTATFESVTVVKPTKIFITAEVDASISYPVSEIILETNYF